MINIEFINNKKLYIQLYERIKSDIIMGKIKENEKLPSKRQIANNLKISINTVQTAYEILQTEGYIRSVCRSGYYVNKYIDHKITNYNVEFITKSKIKEKQYDLTTSSIDPSLFPKYNWSKLTKEVVYNEEIFSLGESNGEYSLKEEIARYIYSSRGVRTSPSNIIIGSGIEYLIMQLTQILPSSYIYGLENPGYKKIYQVLTNLNKRIVFIDDDYINTNSNILYLTPSHQFPTGKIMQIAQRNKVINWLNESVEHYLIEDDYDSEFRYDGTPLLSIQGNCPDKVIYLSTFSRTISPSIRISYMVLPNELAAKYSDMFINYSSTVSRLEQMVLTKFIKDGYYERHLNKSRTLYKKKRDIIQKIIKQNLDKDLYELSKENIGLHYLLTIKKEINETQIKKELLNENIKVNFVSDYCHNIVLPYSSLIIGFSSIQLEEIEKVMSKLLKCLKSYI